MWDLETGKPVGQIWCIQHICQSCAPRKADFWCPRPGQTLFLTQDEETEIDLSCDFCPGRPRFLQQLYSNQSAILGFLHHGILVMEYPWFSLTHCGWLRNPASPIGWFFSPKKIMGCWHHQLVPDFEPTTIGRRRRLRFGLLLLIPPFTNASHTKERQVAWCNSWNLRLEVFGCPKNPKNI